MDLHTSATGLEDLNFVKRVNKPKRVGKITLIRGVVYIAGLEHDTYNN